MIDKMDSLQQQQNLNSVPSEPVEQLEYINDQLSIDALFWDRDSHGLFDFESKILQENTMVVTGCSVIARDKKQ